MEESRGEKRKYEQHEGQQEPTEQVVHQERDVSSLETEEVLAGNVLGNLDGRREFSDSAAVEEEMRKLQDLVANAEREQQASFLMELRSIHMVVRLQDLSPHETYEMFLDESRHSQFTGQPAKIERDVNGYFSLYDGFITGRHVELSKDKRIVQKWRMRDWLEGHYSLVTLSLRKVANGTKVTLTQTGIPADKFEFLQKGWYTFYWDKMNRVDEKELRKTKKLKGDRKSLGGYPILHVEIPCIDMERVKTFYGEVFSWTFKEWTDYYTLFNTQKQPALTGGFWLREKDDIPRDRFITLYIAVDNIEEIMRRIIECGGEQVKEKTFAFEEIGYYAYFRDTEGNVVGLTSREM